MADLLLPRATSFMHRHRRAALVLCLALTAGCRPHAGEDGDPAAIVGPAKGVTWKASVAGPAAATPTIALTASDGTGLRLVEVKARAWVEAPLALTELHLTFENPLDRVLEGNFEIQLPPRSAVSRFGMKIAELWQEGEIVERQAARRIFEDFLHRRQDPALLENDAGDRFRARVFPIPARGRKELIITYSQELAGAQSSYSLPLAGLPRLDSLDVRVLAPHPERADEVIELHRAIETAPADPPALVLREVDGPKDFALRSGDLTLARVTIRGDEATPTRPPPVVTILFDTSASQAADFAARVTRLAALVARLGEVHGAALAVRVWCFDQEALEVYRGSAGGFSGAHVDTIVGRRAAGASDLARALAAIRPGVKAGEQVVVIGDGVATAGATGGAALVDGVKRLRAAGVARIDAVLSGGNRDGATMTQLATAGTDTRAGIVVDGALSPAEIVDKLRRPTFSGIHLGVRDSRWTWPERLDGVQPGDTVIVYADLPADRPLRIDSEGDLISRHVPARAIERPLLERAWVSARIARLVAKRGALPETDETNRRVLRDEVVELSRRYRVLSPFTGLLVLETEDDYRRYDIRRDALADILSVGDRGPVLLRREGERLVVTSERAAEKPELEGDPSATPGEQGAADDADGDGISDSDDRCPTNPETRNGYGDDDGCPDEIPMQLARFSGTIKGIFFAAGSAKITPKSRPVLDRAATVLREFSSINIEISGHCTPEEQPELCGRRAVAVRDYLVSVGVAADRIELRNAGADEPVDTNKTAAGKARNRRIEFTILSGSPASGGSSSAPKPAEAPALSGTFAEVMATLAKDPKAALALASQWRDHDPADVLAVIALGEVLAATGDRRAAARMFGSIIDLYPSRADLRRHAGQRLAALGEAGLALAIDSYAQAVAQRPDHPTGHRLYAYALASAGRHREAFAAILAGLREGSSRQRSGVDAVMRADAATLAAAYIASAPERRFDVIAERQRFAIVPQKDASTSFVLTWETDANDVDLHVYDGAGGHASYVKRELPTGGALVADVTNGYGPELFTIRGAPTAYPYRLEAHYYGQGPMGYGMGTLQVVELDANGELRVDERPFVIMNAGARVALGKLEAVR